MLSSPTYSSPGRRIKIASICRPTAAGTSCFNTSLVGHAVRNRLSVRHVGVSHGSAIFKRSSRYRLWLCYTPTHVCQRNHRIIEYPELEGTHKDHRVQLLGMLGKRILGYFSPFTHSFEGKSVFFAMWSGLSPRLLSSRVVKW